MVSVIEIDLMGSFDEQFSLDKSENLTLFKISGESSEKSSLISCYLHGDESCGYNAIKKQFKDFKKPFFDIYILLGNVDSAKLGMRFIGKNFNRVWGKNIVGDVEVKANNVVSYLREKNVCGVLDLHSFSDANSKPHFFHLNNDFAKSFFDGILEFGFKVGAKENMLIEQFEGIPSFLVECGYHEDKNAIDVGVLCIELFLFKLNFIDATVDVCDFDETKFFDTKFLENETNIKLDKTVEISLDVCKFNLKELDGDLMICKLSDVDEVCVSGTNKFDEIFYVNGNDLYLKKEYFITLINTSNDKMFESGFYVFK